MDTPNHTPQIQSSELLAKASAKPQYAFVSLINLGMILACIYPIAFSWFLSRNSQNWLILLIALPFVAMLIYYIWAILSRTMEVRSDGVKYDEALTKRFFKWNEIESVLIEKWKKQITFQTRGKRIRIHYIGVNPREFVIFIAVFFSKLQEHNIPLIEK